MTKTKEIGYEVGRPAWELLNGFKECWNNESTDIKDKIVNGQGELAVNLSKPIVMEEFLVFLNKKYPLYAENLLTITIIELKEFIKAFIDETK